MIVNDVVEVNSNTDRVRCGEVANARIKENLFKMTGALEWIAPS